MHAAMTPNLKRNADQAFGSSELQAEAPAHKKRRPFLTPKVVTIKDRDMNTGVLHGYETFILPVAIGDEDWDRFEDAIHTHSVSRLWYQLIVDSQLIASERGWLQLLEPGQCTQSFVPITISQRERHCQDSSVAWLEGKEADIQAERHRLKKLDTRSSTSQAFLRLVGPSGYRLASPHRGHTYDTYSTDLEQCQAMLHSGRVHHVYSQCSVTLVSSEVNPPRITTHKRVEQPSIF